MKQQCFLLSVLSILLIESSIGQSTITLRRSFIDSFKNRITIIAKYDVWFTHHRANADKDDGDIHCAGWDNKIGLPTVAEIMNAKNEPAAIELLIAHEGKGKANNQKINITGVWRLWPEHPASGKETRQGVKSTKAQITKGTTNPDHVFEIHPITQIEDIDLVHSLKNIGPDYMPKDWKESFAKFRVKDFTIRSTKKTISFDAKKIGENYIDLWIRIDSLWDVEDGAFAFCTTLASDFDEENDEVENKIITNRTRMVFVKDSETYNSLCEKGTWGFIHILGTPRINLAILSWREWISKKRPEVLKWKLPFEIIADGIIE